jgi:hypothetical protein
MANEWSRRKCNSRSVRLLYVVSRADDAAYGFPCVPCAGGVVVEPF